MMLGKDKTTAFYQALELLHSTDTDSEKKLQGLLTEASNNFGNISKHFQRLNLMIFAHFCFELIN